MLAIFYSVVYFRREARANKVYTVHLQTLIIPTDSASYNIGRHVADNRGCTGCHRADLAGGEAILDNKSPLGVLYATNLTSGKGG